MEHAHPVEGSDRTRRDRTTGGNGTPGDAEAGRRTHWLRLATALACVFFGGALAWWVQTDGGAIEIEDVRFIGTDGTRMSGLLYVPPGATREDPAPAVLAVHGYINSRETQSGFAIELARRGFVVLALDQTGHGYSDPPAFANGFGGPDGLRYLRSLDIVDPDNVGLEGHSMGGSTVLAAARAVPDGYRSISLLGASMSSADAEAGSDAYPRNVGLVFSRWDEFSQLMWASPVASAIVDSEPLRRHFGTDGTVEAGRLYGSLDEGTARMLAMPATTHPGDHLSRAAIGHSIEWLQTTLEGEAALPPGDQVWYWKELGTLLALGGALFAVFPLGALLLGAGWFSPIREGPTPSVGVSGRTWWISAGLAASVPVLTYYGFQDLGTSLFSPNAIWPQGITNGITAWALGNGLITLGLFGAWHFRSRRNTGGAGAAYGLSWKRGSTAGGIGRSLLLAAALVCFVAILLSLSGFFFQTDFRFWVVALKPMSPMHFRIFLAYLVPFLLFFVVLGLALHGQLRSPDRGPGATRAWNVAILAGGFVVLLLVQYVPLLAGRPMPLGEPLLTIVAFQFVPLLAFVALVSTYFFHRTGHVWTGAFFNAFFVTWYIVAGQATHVAVG